MGAIYSKATVKAKATTPCNQHDDRYLILVEFAYKHLNFQLAELESILDLYGFKLGGPDCAILSLPEEEEEQEEKDADETSNSNSKPKHTRPFVILSFPSKDADRLSANEKVQKWDCTKKDNLRTTPTQSSTQKQKVGGIAELLNRCALVRSVVELWGYAATMDDCAAATKRWANQTETGKGIFEDVSAREKSWKMTVHTLGSKYTREEQDGMRSKFSHLGFEGPVKMEDPDNEFILIREVDLDGKGSPRYPRHEGKELVPENDARPPLAVYFGRVLGGARKGRGGLEQYTLKHRAYLGPTSMDAELSFVMTSFGQVQKGSVVYDPFVGTGSILLSCALRGAYCIGSDIDIRVLKGKSETENIWRNFEQFDLQRPEILRTDNSIYHRHFRDHKPLYDAIICDPPYGIRAGARKTGSRLETPRPILDEHRHDHIAQTKPYMVSDVMSDVLDVAARTLVVGGRLVYVIPSFADFTPETDLPRHDCLELVHCCYQPLSLELGRRIVAMKKIHEYDPARRDHYLETIWVNGAESAEKCGNLRDKIMEAAKKKPDYERKAAIRKQKRKAHKEEKKLAKRAKISTTSS